MLFETLRWFKSGSSDDEIVIIFACGKCEYNFHEIRGKKHYFSFNILYMIYN